ncbi:MAG: TolC family protein [candidate division KSB1 bacterium]|nr:TolC family protein [candidate division KSB1 bacterium]
MGRASTISKSAAAARDATRYSFEDTRQNTIYQVHLRYYQLLKDLRLLEVFREAVRSSEEQLKRTQSMYEIGSVAQADVYRAQTTLGQDRINLLQQEFKVQNSRTALNVILGREADAPLEIVDIARGYVCAGIHTRRSAADCAGKQSADSSLQSRHDGSVVWRQSGQGALSAYHNRIAFVFTR